MKSFFNKLQERARLWSLREVDSGGSNYSAQPRPWFINDRPKKTGMQPGEFRIRRKEPRGSDPGNDARALGESVPNQWEWTMGPGECERCQAYVPQLARLDGRRWLCDECAEDEE